MAAKPILGHLEKLQVSLLTRIEKLCPDWLIQELQQPTEHFSEFPLQIIFQPYV
jgi:hypothetical protein